jgi:8-oxo-dGTP diphosphatase
MATVGAAGNDNEEFARPRVASGVLYFDGAGRVMLVKPTYKALWDIPGGYIQPDESPEAALRREVTEGLGTSLPIVGLLAVDWAPRPVEGDKLLSFSTGCELSQQQVAAIRVDGGEISEFAFRERGELDGLLIARLSRRVHAALDARAAGRVMYLEHGAVVPHGG